MPKLTQRDMVRLIALTIRETGRGDDPANKLYFASVTRKRLAQTFADALAREISGFDKYAFMAHCGFDTFGENS